jgi:pimeloyl-ACP methyl ester carboxylesterase
MAKVVVFVPGITPDAGLIERMRELFVQAGYEYLHHNGWQSRGALAHKTLNQLHDELDAVIGNRERVGMLGKSFGAGVGLTSNNPKIKAMVLWAPAFGIAENDNVAFWQNNTLATLTRAADIELSREYLQNIKVPIRIVHGTVDDKIPVSHSEKYQRLLPNAELVLMPGAGHSTHAEEVVRLAVEFFEKHL